MMMSQEYRGNVVSQECWNFFYMLLSQECCSSNFFHKIEYTTRIYLHKNGGKIWYLTFLSQEWHDYKNVDKNGFHKNVDKIGDDSCVTSYMVLLGDARYC